jgi:hypothetical protein
MGAIMGQGELLGTGARGLAQDPFVWVEAVQGAQDRGKAGRGFRVAGPGIMGETGRMAEDEGGQRDAPTWCRP